MNPLFITGTDTEIGKTFVACALLHALNEKGVRAAPMKPLAAGTVNVNGRILNEDVHDLIAVYEACAGISLDPAIVNPYCFAAPIAPHIAAQHENRTVSVEVIQQSFAQLAATHDTVLVEGAGGFLVPMSETQSMAEIPAALGLDVVLVVGLRLGCINHALLTAEAIRAHGLRLAAWVGNMVDPSMSARDENIATLKHLLPAPCLGIVPRIIAADVITAAVAARAHLDVEPLMQNSH